jgi:hypothetical protein
VGECLSVGVKTTADCVRRMRVSGGRRVRLRVRGAERVADM